MCESGPPRRRRIVEMRTAALRPTTVPQYKINKCRRFCRIKCIHHVPEHLSAMSPDFTTHRGHDVGVWDGWNVPVGSAVALPSKGDLQSTLPPCPARPAER